MTCYQLFHQLRKLYFTFVRIEYVPVKSKFELIYFIIVSIRARKYFLCLKNNILRLKINFAIVLKTILQLDGKLVFQQISMLCIECNITIAKKYIYMYRFAANNFLSIRFVLLTYRTKNNSMIMTLRNQVWEKCKFQTYVRRNVQNNTPNWVCACVRVSIEVI